MRTNNHWPRRPKPRTNRPGIFSGRVVEISGLVDSVGLILLDKRAQRPILAKQVGVGERVAHLRRSHGRPGQAGSTSIVSPALTGWADVWYRPLRQAQGRLSGPKRWFSSAVLSRRERMRLWLPALKRVIRAETLSGALKRSFPRINAGAPTANLDKSDFQVSLTGLAPIYGDGGSVLSECCINRVDLKANIGRV